MAALADSGDHKAYNSAAEFWSDESGFSPVIKPDGVLTGLVVTPATSGANDKVDISAGTLNLAGVVTTLTASADITCLRGSDTDICRINSITITSAGAVAVVSGSPTRRFQRNAAQAADLLSSRSAASRLPRCAFHPSRRRLLPPVKY